MEVVQWTRRNKIKNMQICIGPVHLFNYCSHLWPHFHNILFESDHFQKLSNHVWFNFAPSEALIWQLSPLPWSHSPVSSPRLGQENWFPITTIFSILCWSDPPPKPWTVSLCTLVYTPTPPSQSSRMTNGATTSKLVQLCMRTYMSSTSSTIGARSTTPCTQTTIPHTSTLVTIVMHSWTSSMQKLSISIVSTGFYTSNNSFPPVLQITSAQPLSSFHLLSAAAITELIRK